MKYSLDLMFKNGMAQIYIKNETHDENGNIFLTPFCASIKEVEEQIERLKAELETIRKKAEKEFPQEKCKVQLFE